MRRMLGNRIEQLEERAAMTRTALESKPVVWDEYRTAKLLRAMRTIDYRTWRHAGLSLEQLLALARDDSALAQANPRSTWSPGYLQAEPGAWVNIWPAVGAREFEIQILERDGKIDAETAQSLSKNIHDRFFVSGPVTEHAYGAPLTPLPHAIAFDEAAALKAARLQCPYFDSLPLEGQLEYLEEDLLKSRQHAAASRQHATAVALRAPRSKEALHAEMLARLGDRGPNIETEITKLREKIAERDRSTERVMSSCSLPSRRTCDEWQSDCCLQHLKRFR
jgi:hypothetical protein